METKIINSTEIIHHRYGDYRKQINFTIFGESVIIVIKGRINQTEITISKNDFDNFIKEYKGK